MNYLVNYIDKKLSAGNHYGIKDGYFYYRQYEGRAKNRDIYGLYRYTIINNQLRGFTKLTGVVVDIMGSVLGVTCGLFMIYFGVKDFNYPLIFGGLIIGGLGGSISLLQRKKAREEMERLWKLNNARLPEIK